MSAITRVAVHRFRSDDSLPQRDGVNLAHTEVNALLAAPLAHSLEVTFHDFDALLRSDAAASRALQGVDCVLSNVGPHAHYYYALRERLGLDFRIVRDIKTALWSCYLLQEALCQPYLRAGDSLLATSVYSRALCQRLFPHLRDHPIHLFEPVLSQAAAASATAPKRPAGDIVTLGHIGRLSEDKNFPQMVDLLLELHRQEPGRYRLLACGAVHSESCDPRHISARVHAQTGRNDLFTYLPPVEHEAVPGIMARFDWFLFFSTSNLEVLGRVLIEAAAARVPVLAADHAAAAELLHPSSLLPVSYFHERPFHSHFDAPLGRVDIGAAAQRIRCGEWPKPPPVSGVNDPQRLLRPLQDPCALPHDGPAGLASAAAAFVAQLQWADLPRYARREEADAAIEQLRDWFCALNGKTSPGFAQRLQALEIHSRFPERTRRFVQAAARTRCDFTNLGGLDMELCNIAGFHPRFWLSQEAADRRAPQSLPSSSEAGATLG